MIAPVPFSMPDIGEAEIAEVVRVLRSGWITTGPCVAQFEQEFRESAGSRHALAVNSCTSGLHLALAALGLGPGDEVITTPLTFCATVNTILQVGATPVLADIDEDLNISPAAIRSAINSRTRAVVPVHLAGLPCRMQEIHRIARDSNLAVVEDAAHAVGALYRGRAIGGGPSDAVVFSFYATKNLTTGEGGMVTTGSSELDQRMRRLALHGMSQDAWKRYGAAGHWYYEVVDCGFKYNMSDVMAAIGIQQLRRLEQMTRRRTEIAQAYNQAFSELPELELPPDRADSRHCWHLYILRLRSGGLSVGRDEFICELRERGVGCSVHFIPIPRHPYYRRVLRDLNPCPCACSEYGRMLSLPLYSRMDDAAVARVIEAVCEVVGRFRRKRVAAVAEAAAAAAAA